MKFSAEESKEPDPKTRFAKSFSTFFLQDIAVGGILQVFSIQA
jgi:hypothetical protein